MKCPQCKTSLACPCEHCRKAERKKEGEEYWEWDEMGMEMLCPKCKIIVDETGAPDETE